MLEKVEKPTHQQETIQDIAVRLLKEQVCTLPIEKIPKEQTIFVLGSKCVGKSTAINKFFDREYTNPKPTLALEYSYGRRSQKQVLNIWELGSLKSSSQLFELPLRMQGIEHFSSVLMLDLSQPQCLWSDLEEAFNGLKKVSDQMLDSSDDGVRERYRNRAAERIKKNHNEISTLDLQPFPIVLVGGKYDLFIDQEPETKMHVCRFLRSVAHLVGGSLLFYSSKLPKLAKTLRDTFNHLGFGSPTNPFRSHTVDFNDALSIWFGTDSWDNISNAGPQYLKDIGAELNKHVPQLQVNLNIEPVKEPANDAGFREGIIDEMRSQKMEELKLMLKQLDLRVQFENVGLPK
ncbi:cytoplasmic dynein 2 light intermediate chain 1 [Teleopsis dalmanni]|uniref:cytoplasmic dynein 2 light intermediate chain 1 n=1 Tax=Teleopsis dalmanni TaxID=139649 RepID=UPI0018CD8313|nr:cytoplasmic dynein 2 light intermediate chain 1 [Teleopsis dalmanni]